MWLMDINTLFPDVETLRVYVKVTSATPDVTLRPFLKEAFEAYVVRYFSSMLEVMEKDVKAVELARMTVGPLAMALAADEMSVNIGDSGITVQSNRNGNLVPASDAKIQAAKLAMAKRGFRALEGLCRHVMERPETYPELRKEDWAERLAGILPTYTDFSALVAMPCLFMAFLTVAPVIRQLQEMELKAAIGETLYGRLVAYARSGRRDEAFERLLNAAKCFLCNKAAYLFSSSRTKEERCFSGNMEFPAAVYPLFYDVTDTGNFYGKFAEKAMAAIQDIMGRFQEELGVGKPEALEYNGPERKVFYSLG